MVAASLAGVFVASTQVETFEENEPIAATLPAVKKIEHVNLNAGSAYVLDLATNTVLFEKNADKPRPLASLVKMMTALVAIELAPKNTRVTVTAEALSQDGSNGLFLNEVWNIRDLTYFSLIESSNDAAFAVASKAGALNLGTDNLSAGEKYFIEKMNERAAEIGLEDTRFKSVTGLDLNDETEASAFGSARDIAKLFAYILKNYPDLIEVTEYQGKVFISESNNTHRAVNTNTLIGEIPGLMGSKTGYTNISGGNLAIVFDAGVNRPIIAVVLGSTHDGRFSDIQTLVQETFKTLQSNDN